MQNPRSVMNQLLIFIQVLNPAQPRSLRRLDCSTSAKTCFLQEAPWKLGSVVQAETLLPEIPDAHSMMPVGFSSEALALRSLTRLYLQIPHSPDSLHFFFWILGTAEVTCVRLLTVPPPGCCKLPEGADCAFSLTSLSPEPGTELGLDNQYYFVH